MIDLHMELVASIETTGTIMSGQYTIRLRNIGIAFSQAICVIVKYISKALLEIGF